MIKVIEPTLYNLGAIKINKIDNIIMPDYLYRLPNNIWLSINYNIEKKTSMTVNLGTLYTYYDEVPRVVVLQNLSVYSEIIDILRFSDMFFPNVSNEASPEVAVNYLLKNLKLILDNYEFFKKFWHYQEHVKTQLKSYNKKVLKDISDCDRIEDEIVIPNEKVDIKIKKKIQRKNHVYSALGEGLAEIIFYIVCGALGLLFLSLFSFGDKIIDKLDIEGVILIGMLILFVPLGIILFLIMRIHKFEIKDGIQLHPLYNNDQNIINDEYIQKKFDFLVKNGYQLKYKENKFQRSYKYKNDNIIIEIIIVDNVINCFIKSLKTNKISILHCEYVEEGFDIKYYQANNYERIEMIADVFIDNKRKFNIKGNI